jgi:hypothetical protein
MKRFLIGIFWIAVASLGTLAPAGVAQSVADTNFPTSDAASSLPSKPQPQLDLIYKRPTEKAKLHSYFFDAFGPYAIAGATVAGALDQAHNTPREWGQGWGAYGERVGSNFGIAVVTTTTRYALAEAFHEDTIYYRCECKGVLPRLRHAAISTVTARHGDDGRRRVSVAAIVAPFAGSMTAIYGWYPGRFGAGDGLRMGSYAVLGSLGGNIASEFIYGGPHTLFGRNDRSASSGAVSVASSNP